MASEATEREMTPRRGSGSHPDLRADDRLVAHYLVERELADSLRDSSRAERLTRYRDAYDELYRRVPDHPMLTRKYSSARSQAAVANSMRQLRPRLAGVTSFLEIGAGDCELARSVAQIVDRVYAVEVSEEISRPQRSWPANLKVVISDGLSIPVPAASVDLAFSNQLLEHLHPDDAEEQAGNVCTALRPGGTYFAITPNAVTGPHDISQFFDEVATGFHLKEWTTQELAAMFLRAGFSNVSLAVRIKRYAFSVPRAVGIAAERAAAHLTLARRRQIAHSRLGSLLGLSDITVLAQR